MTNSKQKKSSITVDPDYSRGPSLSFRHGQPVQHSQDALFDTAISRPFVGMLPAPVVTTAANAGGGNGETSLSFKSASASPASVSKRPQRLQQQAAGRSPYGPSLPAAGQQPRHRSSGAADRVDRADRPERIEGADRAQFAPPIEPHQSSKALVLRVDTYLDSLPFSSLSLSSDERILANIQQVYMEIVRLEEISVQTFERLTRDVPGDQSSASLYRLWHRAHVHQLELVSHYCDFITLATHPRAATATRSLIIKYKMLSRVRHKGVFDYISILLSRAPPQMDIDSLVIDFFNLLLPLAADELAAHSHSYHAVWQECLASLARCVADSASQLHSTMINWVQVAQYWYSRACLNRSGFGRMYYHHALTFQASDVEYIYLLTKSLTAVDRLTSVDRSETSIRQLVSRSLSAALDGQQAVSIAANSTDVSQVQKAYPDLKSLYLLFHQQLVEGRSDQEVSHSVDRLFSELHTPQNSVYFMSTTPSRTYFSLGSAFIAFSNIAAVMDYGTPDNLFAREFYHKTTPSKVNVSRSPNALKASLMMLTRYLDISFASKLMHILVWMHFLYCIAPYPELVREIVLHPIFPGVKLVKFLQLMERSGEKALSGLSKSARGIDAMTSVAASASTGKTNQAMVRRVASAPSGADEYVFNKESSQYVLTTVEKRPLPEEVCLAGYVWADRSRIRFGYMKNVPDFLEMNATTYIGPLRFDSLRVERVLALAQEIAAENSWLQYQPGVGYKLAT